MNRMNFFRGLLILICDILILFQIIVSWFINAEYITLYFNLRAFDHINLYICCLQISNLIIVQSLTVFYVTLSLKIISDYWRILICLFAIMMIIIFTYFDFLMLNQLLLLINLIFFLCTLLCCLLAFIFLTLIIISISIFILIFFFFLLLPLLWLILL